MDSVRTSELPAHTVEKVSDGQERQAECYILLCVMSRRLGHCFDMCVCPTLNQGLVNPIIVILFAKEENQKLFFF